MKALVLAGGRGKRINEYSAARNKCMIRVKDQPVIQFSLDNAAALGVREIVIVVGYRAEEIINRYGTAYRGIPIRYVIQWERHGLVHAMECARATIDGDDFALFLGDEIMLNPRHKEMVRLFDDEELFTVCGTLRVRDKSLIRRTYMVIQDESNTIYRLVEKPRNPLNHNMGTGNCLFRNKIFDYIETTPVHHDRKEKELPDLIQCAIDDGKKVKSFNVCDRYTNINSIDDMKTGNSFFLKT